MLGPNWVQAKSQLDGSTLQGKVLRLERAPQIFDDRGPKLGSEPNKMKGTVPSIGAAAPMRQRRCGMKPFQPLLRVGHFMSFW